MPQWIIKICATVATNVILKLGEWLVEWLEEKKREAEIKNEAKKGIKDVKKIKDRKERAKAMDDYLSFMRDRVQDPRD